MKRWGKALLAVIGLSFSTGVAPASAEVVLFSNLESGTYGLNLITSSYIPACTNGPSAAQR